MKILRDRQAACWAQMWRSNYPTGIQCSAWGSRPAEHGGLHPPPSKSARSGRTVPGAGANPTRLGDQLCGAGRTWKIVKKARCWHSASIANSPKSWPNNVGGAEATLEAGTTVSTDAIFDGQKRETSFYYTETDEPNPLNVYAQSKLDGEQPGCRCQS